MLQMCRTDLKKKITAAQGKNKVQPIAGAFKFNSQMSTRGDTWIEDDIYKWSYYVITPAEL